MKMHHVNHVKYYVAALVSIVLWCVAGATAVLGQDAGSSGVWSSEYYRNAVTGYRDDVAGGVDQVVITEDGSLYAASWDLGITNVPGTAFIARWDGEEWSAVGEGVSAGITDMAAWGSSVYVAGFFRDELGERNSDIMHWNGVQWHAIPYVYPGRLPVLAATNDKLYAGEVAGLYAWDGAAWENVAERYQITVLNAADGVVYFAVLRVNGEQIHRVGRLEGENLAWMGEGFDNRIRDIAVFDGSIYVVGDFSQTLDGRPIDRVARWDGNRWVNDGATIPSPGRIWNIEAGETALRLTFDSKVWMRNDDGWIAETESGGYDADLDLLGDQIIVSGGGSSTPLMWSDDGWTAFMEPAKLGLDGDVHAFTTYGGSLYAAGEFNVAGFDQAVHPLVVLQDGQWESAGMGPDGTVHALALWNNQLVAGGRLSSGDGMRLGTYDGTVWTPIDGLSRSDQVNALLASGDRLIVGGRIRDAGEVAGAENIAVWTGSQWESLGEGLSREVLTLASWEGDIVAGGRFTNADGQDRADYLSRWNGTSWQAIGDEAAVLNGAVHAMAVGSDGLYVGGEFTDVDGIAEADYLARWDGTQWHAVAPGLDGRVTAILLADRGVVVGGAFTSANGVAGTSHIARWDGQLWQALGAGLNDKAHALTLHPERQTLFAGGEFTETGDGQIVSQHVGEFEQAFTPTAYEARPSLPSGMHLEAFPNPANTTLHVTLKRQTASGPADLVVYDLLGREYARVETTPYETDLQMTINTQSWPSGVYVLRVVGGSMSGSHLVHVVH